MLTSEQELFIEKTLDRNDINEVMLQLILKYCKRNTNKAKEIIKLNTDIAELIIDYKDQEINKQKEGLFWSICQRDFDKSNKIAYFSSMVPVCKAHFPYGTCDGKSVAAKQYFNEFLSLFRNESVFSWDQCGDWAKECGYYEYLKLIDKLN